jgi:hypothetical protein
MPQVKISIPRAVPSSIAAQRSGNSFVAAAAICQACFERVEQLFLAWKNGGREGLEKVLREES